VEDDASEEEKETPMRPERLSYELREERDGHLGHRRRIAALSLTAAGSMGVIALYQMGVIRRLPEPPLPDLNAEEVDSAPEAYEKLSMPDAALGLTSYAVTLSLAAAGGKDRSRDRPWLPLLLAGKLGLDAAQAAKLTRDQWTKHRAFCSWCLLAAGATFIAAPLAWPEARDGARRLLRRDGEEEAGEETETERQPERRAVRRWSSRRSPETGPQRAPGA
jgi:hypothetical protein